MLPLSKTGTAIHRRFGQIVCLPIRKYLKGGLGDDYLYGADGDDLLNGDAGNDSIYSGNGNDTLMEEKATTPCTAIMVTMY
ncbi:hypothetical protein [Neisseria meningitidis]